MTFLPLLHAVVLAAGSAAGASAAGSDAPISPLIEGTVSFVLGVLCLAVVLSLIRLIRGPNIADRVVALDLTSTIIVGIIAVLSIATSEPTFLSVSMVLALVAFLGTVAFAYYVQRGGQP
jgi:multicomponent Na+:H+ antiporter subunit F